MLFNFPLSPPQASTFAAEHDFVFYLLSALTAVFTLIVGVCVVWFALRYREGTKASRANPTYDSLKIELTWTIIPLILGLIMFVFGARLFVRERTMPEDAERIYVIGKQWMWQVQHANGVRENNTLHVPVGKKVRLTMISQDVIHAFYIPAFRAQYHVVPGRYTQMWFEATRIGEYHLFCGMYCGTQHSEMGGKVVVMSQTDYARWLANGGESGRSVSMEQAGQKVWTRLGCGNCHGAEDNYRAPTLANIMGRTRKFTNGQSMVADESYLRESILRPYNHLTAGYGQTMPAYDKQISEDDVLALIALIRSLGSGAAPAPVTAGSGSIAGQNAQTEARPPMEVGAMAAQRPKSDATPTRKGANPSVGAMAAQGATN